MTKQEMINELIHYANCDLLEKTEEEIKAMYVAVFGEDE